MTVNGALVRTFSSVKVVIVTCIAVAGVSSAATIWFVTQTRTPAQIEGIKTDIKESEEAITGLKSAVEAQGDSLRRLYGIQEFIFCTSVPRNKRSTAATFNIDCSKYDDQDLPPLAPAPDA